MSSPNWKLACHKTRQFTVNRWRSCVCRQQHKIQVTNKSCVSRVCSPCDKGLIPSLGCAFFSSVLIASRDKLDHVASKFCISLRENFVRKEFHKMWYLHVSLVWTTFSLLERSWFALSSTSGVLFSCRALDAGAWGPLIWRPSSSSDVWLLLFRLTGTFCLACFSLDVYGMGATFSFSLIFDLLLRSENDSSSTGLCCLPSGLCCRRWVSSPWICSLLHTAESDLLRDWHCCGDKLERGGSKGRKPWNSTTLLSEKYLLGHLSKTISRIPGFGWELIFCVGIISISETDILRQLEERIKQNKQFQLHGITTDKIWNQ